MNYYIVMVETQEVFTMMGGRVKMIGPTYRPTCDAVWAAAFADGNPKTVLDVGTGTGAVALCLMARMPNVQMTAIDISQDMLDVAAENFKLNNRDAELINADITTWRTSKTFDLVITNPPYFKGTPANHNAHHNADLNAWVGHCIARVKPNGTFIIIIDATETANIISEMTRHHCGNINILPLFSVKHTAERVLISGTLGRATNVNLFTGLSINNDAVLRDGISIAEILAAQAVKKR